MTKDRTNINVDQKIFLRHTNIHETTHVTTKNIEKI